jgi:hypothetical protein
MPAQLELLVPTNRQIHLTFKANLKAGRHGWLRLTPAYSVHLVEKLVSDLAPSDVVLDPFCGTGTTALVCAQHGIEADTVDINPFLVWLATAKCSTYSKRDCEAAATFPVHSAIGDHWVPPIKDISKWWDHAILSKLANIFRQIQNAPISEKAKDLLKVSFCRLIIKTANVSFGHQSMSFKKNTANGEMAHFIDNQFSHLVVETCVGASQPLKSNARALIGDSRNLEKVLPHNRYTAVITSPPYPNRMSYIRELRPYMYWFGFLGSGKEAGELDWKAIGGTWGCATSNLTKWTPDATVSHEGFDATLQGIARRSPLLSLYVHKYFVDVVHHLRHLKPCIKRGGKLFYVVGNSKFYDTMLHTEEIYASLMSDAGFELIGIENIRKRSSKKELFEFIVKARKR